MDMYVKNSNKLPSDHKLSIKAPAKDEAGFYTWEKKIEVATKYMALGNMRLVSELCKVDYRTLVNWKKEKWWADLIDEIKKSRQTETNSKLSKLVDMSLDVIKDRLKNGDFILNNKTGSIDRKPVSLRDANSVAKDLLGAQIRMEEMTSKLEIQKESVQEQLKLLANEFSKWSKGLSKQNAQTINFKEVANALHDQREERLQEGSGEVYEQAIGGEEEGSAEQGQEDDDGQGFSPQGGWEGR
jgi:hypothetical protein